MPCGCGSKTKTPEGAPAFVHRDDTGKVVKEGSEIQALASQVRSGGAGTVEPA